MSKRKIDSKTFAQQKRRRRQFLTFVRMCRYGVNNFSRNAWLTIAATAVMTITLLIIFSSIAAHTILSSTVDGLRNKVAMSIYLQTDTPNSVGSQLIQQVEQLSSVESATYETSAQAQQDFIQENSSSPSTINAITQATNAFPAVLHITVKNIDDTTQLSKFVVSNSLVKQYLNPSFAPSFAGDQKAAIQSIGRAVDFAQEAGFGAGILFVAISTLIIFNTIRMAIFNRKEEIQMMKLIGADKSFIRGPFIVEAIVYGFIAAILATGIGLGILFSIQSTLQSYQIAIGPTITFVTFYGIFVLLGMIAAGAVIGVISSLLATARYLKL
jgi:cell division transport system permease protein